MKLSDVFTAYSLPAVYNSKELDY